MAVCCILTSQNICCGTLDLWTIDLKVRAKSATFIFSDSSGVLNFFSWLAFRSLGDCSLSPSFLVDYLSTFSILLCFSFLAFSNPLLASFLLRMSIYTLFALTSLDSFLPTKWACNSLKSSLVTRSSLQFVEVFRGIRDTSYLVYRIHEVPAPDHFSGELRFSELF